MNFARHKYFFLGLGITLVAVLLSVTSPDLFKRIDQGIVDEEYRLRGETKIDSSIVIVYFDNDDITALGGLPLKRSYYALLLQVLSELNVRAVGMDIAFTETNNGHSEYEDLLATVVERNGNVILGGYFRSLSDSTSQEHGIPAGLLYDSLPVIAWSRGNHPVLPTSKLLKCVKSAGHTHIGNEFDLPSFVQSGSNLFPAFSLELFRVGVGADRQGVHISSSGIDVVTDKHTYQIPIDKAGNVFVNIKGGTKSLHMLSAVKLLKYYDMIKSGIVPPSQLEYLKGKIILVGIIAEGSSKFVNTPFTSDFPSIGIHAMFVDNALHGTFTRRVSDIFVHLLVFIVGVLSTLLMSIKKEIFGIMGVATLFLLLLVESYILFLTASIVFPLFMPILTGLIAAVSVLIYQHKSVSEHAYDLTREQERITNLLQEKELKLHALESNLQTTRQQDIAKHRTQTAEEVKSYQEEIRRLKIIAADLQPSVGTINRQPGIKQEFCGIIYGSKSPMEEIVSLVKKIADSKSTVLLQGESGTGKELVALALHSQSGRKTKPFVAVNCGALSETLLESELFGHEKGAFTGAMKERAGRFELADSGTIFLDEIGETSEAFQIKLLRVLQDGTFERVGGTTTRRVNIRIIAATNKNLEQMVIEKKFREDLYYRLNVFTVRLPALRERAEDIPLLVEHFIALEEAGLNCSASVMNTLKQYSWKGNIRELQSIIKRAVLLSKAEGRAMLRLKDFPEEIAKEQNVSVNIEEQILRLLREKEFSRSSISETADDIGGLNRGTVAEYFRGYCFKAFVESEYDVAVTAKLVAQSSDELIHKKVEKKLIEYIGNAIEHAKSSQSGEQVILASKPKYKNLPQKYHNYLDEIIASAHRGEWALKQ